MYIVLVQHLHLVPFVVSRLNAIPSLVILDLTLQEVLLPIQDESGDVMEDSEWAHKGSR